jgi:4-hydroxy-tetrahydrodipicolinate synthase
MGSRPGPFEGVIASLITPFHADGTVAWDELNRETELLSGSPVDALCVGGLMSETEGSTPEEIGKMCEAVSRRAKKPVVAMIYPDSQPEAAELVRAVDAGGVQAVFVAQPHYLCQPGLAGLAEMLAELRNVTRLPVLLANCQRNAMVDLADMWRLIQIGVVDGILLGGDGVHLMVDLLCLHPNVPVLSAMEDLHYVSLLLGARGIVSDLAAVFPGEVAALYRSWREGNYDGARTCHERLVRLWRALDHPSELRSRLRAALTGQRRRVGDARSPYNLASADASRQVWAAIEREGLAVSS